VAELPEDAVETDDLFPDEEEVDVDDLLALSDDAIENIDADEDIEIVDAEPLPLGRSWAYDFQAGEFVRDGKAPATLRGDGNLIGWIEKCLRTAQGSAVALPPEFGLARPLGDYIGGDPDEAVQLETDIVDALTFHPNIQAVEDVEIEIVESDLGEDTAVAVSFLIVQGDGSEIEFDGELEVEPV
jgi:hypothetical protein